MTELKNYDFRLIDGMWRDVLNHEQKTLAQVLQEYGLLVDDRAQFCRLYDFDLELEFKYRAHAARVELFVYSL